MKNEKKICELLERILITMQDQNRLLTAISSEIGDINTNAECIESIMENSEYI